MEQPKNTTDAKVAGGNTIPAEVTWAQRSSATEPEKNHVFLAINAPDVSPSNIKLDITANKLTFTGYSETKKATYHTELEFYAEIDPSASKTHHSPRAVEFVLQKKDLKVEFWPRLLKTDKKMHFLKTDFDKWVDEDEQDVLPDEEDYMSRMGGMGGAGGPPGAGGMGGGEGGFGGIDFSKLGGAGGAGGAGGMGGMDMESLMAQMGQGGGMGGMGGMGDDEEDDDEEDDDEMPVLEGEDSKAGAAGSSAASGSKIEEIE